MSQVIAGIGHNNPPEEEQLMSNLFEIAKGIVIQHHKDMGYPPPFKPTAENDNARDTTQTEAEDYRDECEEAAADWREER